MNYSNVSMSIDYLLVVDLLSGHRLIIHSTKACQSITRNEGNLHFAELGLLGLL